MRTTDITIMAFAIYLFMHPHTTLKYRMQRELKDLQVRH